MKTAFLNAGNVGEDYVRLPKCAVREGDSGVRNLEKASYGLRRAPKAWNSTFTAWAVEGGFEQLQSEVCMYVHKEMRQSW